MHVVVGGRSREERGQALPYLRLLLYALVNGGVWEMVETTATKPGKRRTRAKAGKRTFRDIFLAELGNQSKGEPKLVNNRTLREALEWPEDRYTRIKEQLRNENLIVVSRGGPGGAVALGVATGLPAKKALTVFISYCHADEELKDELIKHLTPLKRLNLISDWHYRKLVAGQKWGEEISNKLDAASIVLLLVSIDFINSEYCYQIEMDRALERSDGKDCVVIHGG